MSIETNATRRRFMTGGTYALALAAGGRFTRMANAQAPTLELPIANGQRNLVAFPEKRPLIVLTSRPPQLETPFEVFNEGLITPNDAFFVRYHNAAIPTSIDGDKHVIKIGGNAVRQAVRAHDGRTAHAVQAGRDRRGQPVLGQQPRPVQAARHRRAARQRRDGQRALARRAAEGRAGARRAEGHGAPGDVRRPGHRP